MEEKQTKKKPQKTVKNLKIEWKGRFQVYQRWGRNIFFGAGYYVGFVVYL